MQVPEFAACCRACRQITRSRPDYSVPVRSHRAPRWWGVKVCHAVGCHPPRSGGAMYVVYVLRILAHLGIAAGWPYIDLSFSARADNPSSFFRRKTHPDRDGSGQSSWSRDAMQINFSHISENLARIYGDADCIINVERERRYSFREFHRLTNRIVNMMRSRLDLPRGDRVDTQQRQPVLAQLVYGVQGRCAVCHTNTTDTSPDQARQIDLVKPKVVLRGRTVAHALRAVEGAPGPSSPWTRRRPTFPTCCIFGLCSTGSATKTRTC